MNNELSKKSQDNRDIENILSKKGTLYKIKKTKNLFGEKIKENKKKSIFKLSRNYKNNRGNIYYDKIIIKNHSMPKIKSKTLNIEQNNNYMKDLKVDINNDTKKFNPYKTATDFKIIQTNINSKYGNNSQEFTSKKNNKVSFGKSLNEIIIDNIKEIIKNKGHTIQNIKKKNYSTIIYRPGYNIYNNYELHKKIFDLKLVEIYENYEKRKSELRKQRIEKLSPELELKRQEMKVRMPLLIRGYNKKDLDIFYTKNICDLDYQNHYNENQLNMKEVVAYHNQINRKEYLSGNVPFFLLTKSVLKPIFKKILSQNINNKIKKGIKEISL